LAEIAMADCAPGWNSWVNEASGVPLCTALLQVRIMKIMLVCQMLGQRLQRPIRASSGAFAHFMSSAILVGPPARAMREDGIG
jgi:hypothetical protein